MLYSYSMHDDQDPWPLAMTAVSTVTGVLLLLSIAFSIFGFKMLSQLSWASDWLA